MNAQQMIDLFIENILLFCSQLSVYETNCFKCCTIQYGKLIGLCMKRKVHSHNVECSWFRARMK